VPDRLARIRAVERYVVLCGVNAQRRRQHGIGKPARRRELRQAAVGIGEVGNSQFSGKAIAGGGIRQYLERICERCHGKGGAVGVGLLGNCAN